MRFEKVTKQTDLPELGITITLQVVDNKVEAVTIGEGDISIRIVSGGSYSNELKVLKPESKQAKTVFVVSGKLLGISDVREEFDDKHDADARLSKIMTTAGVWDEEELGVSVKEEIVYVSSTSI